MNFFLSKFRSNSFGFIEILSRLINWGCLPLVSLYVAPDVFGQVVLLYSYIIFITALGGFGQQRIILMYGSRDVTSFYASSLISLLAVFFIFFIASYFLTINTMLLPVVVISVLINNLVSLSRSRESFFDFCLYRIGSSVSRLLFVVIFLMCDPSIQSYIYAEIAAILSISIFWVFKGRASFTTSNFDVNYKKLMVCFSFGFPLFLQVFVTYLLQVGDRFVISKLLGHEALGAYFFVSVFCTCVAFIFSFNAQKYEIRIYNSVEFKEAKSWSLEFCKNSLKHCLYFFPLSCAAYYVLALVSKKYDMDFYLMAQLYLFHSFSIFFITSTFLFSYLNKNFFTFLLSFFNSLIFLIILYFLIPYYNLNSVAIAGAFVNIVSFLVFLFLYNSDYIGFSRKLNHDK